MFLILTDPKPHDFQSLFQLTQEPDLRKEFQNFKTFSMESIKEFIEYWDGINKQNEVQFFRLIKYSPLNVGQTSIWDDSNSILLGFISNENYVSNDSTCKTTINYGVFSKFRNRGVVTLALKMAIDRMKSQGYNYAAAYVKHGNYPSIRVLEKCNFHIDAQGQGHVGTTYIKFLNNSDN